MAHACPDFVPAMRDYKIEDPRQFKIFSNAEGSNSGPFHTLGKRAPARARGFESHPFRIAENLIIGRKQLWGRPYQRFKSSRLRIVGQARRKMNFVVLCLVYFGFPRFERMAKKWHRVGGIRTF
jgi:hypothetical protein